MDEHTKDDPDAATAQLLYEATRKLVEQFGGKWNVYLPGNFIPGEPIAGLAQFTEDDAGRQVLTGLVMVGSTVTSDLLRKVPVQQLENANNMTEAEARERLAVELAALPPLRREPGMSPYDFSKLVADHYRAWAKAVPHPASAMAAAVKVKPPTMHTWIREARLRGFLPETARKKTAREMWEQAVVARERVAWQVERATIPHVRDILVRQLEAADQRAQQAAHENLRAGLDEPED